MSDVVEWVAVGIATAAFGTSAVALRWARRSAIAAERSAVAAEGSASSSRDAADAARDDADVALRAERAQLQAAEDAAVTWEVRWLGTAVVNVRNTGERTAYDVGVALSPLGGGNPILIPNVHEVHPGNGMRVDARSHNKPGAWIEVAWYPELGTSGNPRRKRLGLG